MKKFLTIFALVAICACVYAGDFLQDTGNRIAVEAQKVPAPRERIVREAPEWEWAVEPQALLFSMYDYFHAYTCLPVSTQSADMGGGTFLAYRTAESTGGVHNIIIFLCKFCRTGSNLGRNRMRRTLRRL